MEELILNGVIALLGLVGTWVLAKLKTFLSAKADLYAEQTKMSFIQNLDDVLMAYVTEVYELETKALKEAAADGKLSADEKAKLKKIVVDRAKAHFSWATLAKLFGGEAAEAALSAKVEQSLVNVKANEAYLKKP